jgi:hypothetical protein
MLADLVPAPPGIRGAYPALHHHWWMGISQQLSLYRSLCRPLRAVRTV